MTSTTTDLRGADLPGADQRGADQCGATLDPAHVGDIRGALGTISAGDLAARRSMPARLKTLLAIAGPGLIVMIGDNDAGAFSVYGQAGQNYGTKLLWTFLLLIPVLYVNQEMVLRLGAVTGVGHARLILERYGRFWGAFSVIDLFILNALTIVTEFIGITLAAGYLGVPKVIAVGLAALVIVASAMTGSFRRFERIAMAFCAGSLLLIPVYLLAHPPAAEVARGFVLPSVPGGGQLATVMLLIIGIVGTTVAPWQLFFQQSYVIDKRITPRFIRYERADLVIGIGIVIAAGAAIMGATTAAFAGTVAAGHYTDAAGLASGLAAYAGRAAGALFAVALLDAAMIGAFAVSLSTAYAMGDVLGMKHSLHRGARQAKGFYLMYAGLIGGAAAIVLIPGSPLGLLTEGVQVLAGVLLPSATVFLLLLCNDKAVLGPWVNGRWTNAFSVAVVALLIALSLVLTASVAFPQIRSGQIIAILIGCAVVTLLTGAALVAAGRVRAVRAARAGTGDRAGTAGGAGAAGAAGAAGRATAGAGAARTAAVDRSGRENWRMPRLGLLAAPQLSSGRKLGLTGLRIYLAITMVVVVIRITQDALGH
jgi:Mn2+/Fe2+ NRAMP family transporter